MSAVGQRSSNALMCIATGHLTAKEVAAALRSRNVDLTEAIVQKFIEGEQWLPNAPTWHAQGSNKPAKPIGDLAAIPQSLLASALMHEVC